MVQGDMPRDPGLRPAWGLPRHFGAEITGADAAGSEAAGRSAAARAHDHDLAWSAAGETQLGVAASAPHAAPHVSPHAFVDDAHVQADHPEERAASVAVGAEDGSAQQRREGRTWQSTSKWVYAIVGVFMLLAIGYGIDLVTSLGKVPRGTEVAGVSVGSMDPVDAENKLLNELGEKTNQPVAVRAGAVTTELDPKKVGLSVDWSATLERAGEQPLNPITRIVSFFKSRDVGIVSRIPDQRLTGYLETLSREANFAPREGAIWFDQATVKSIMPLDGQQLRVEDSRTAILEHWLDEAGVDLPVDYTPTETSAEQVQNLIDTIAEPAVSEPLILMGSQPQEDGEEPPIKDVPLPLPSLPGEESTPRTTTVPMVDPQGPNAFPVEFPRERIGEYLTFVRNGSQIEPQYNAEAAKGILNPLLEETQAEGRDASFNFSADTVTVEPAVRGRTVQWGPLLAGLQAGLADRGPRTVPVTYETVEPEMTTEDAEKAGIREVVGEYTVDVGASGAAQTLLSDINGTFLGTGKTANLSELSTTVSGDRGADAVATAMFNAAYEAGLSDLQRSPRAVQDDAFPEARDATASRAVAFTNQQSTGIVIEAYGTSSSVTVRLWGTKQYSVRTETNDRVNVQRASMQRSTSPDCEPVSPRDGYTTEVTRIVEQGEREVSRETFQSTYAPVDGVTCAAPAPGPGEPSETSAPNAPTVDVPQVPGLQIPLPFEIPGITTPG